MRVKNTFLPVQTTLSSRGRVLDLASPVVMGIINATPDSFFNRGAHSDVESIVRQAELMCSEGALILDIGGVSTRPGSTPPPVEEELNRVLPAVRAVRDALPDVWISVDTYNAGVASEAVSCGADIINDISGGRLDEEMLAAIARLQVPYIIMHMQGTPQTMQLNPQYDDVVLEVTSELMRQCELASDLGVKDIILDPGFGFGKTQEHNFRLLAGLHSLRICGRPVLAGISRKSMICRTLDVKPTEALNGTTALHMVALQQGASILRVHDVKEAVEVIKLFQAFDN
ncbi:MAG: dihydropteroate synthase [Sphingobacteriales bacterium]|nr:MAG: dihydropteroate synthase [Sphingobacteriales bacterium]